MLGLGGWGAKPHTHTKIEVGRDKRHESKPFGNTELYPFLLYSACSQLFFFSNVSFLDSCWSKVVHMQISPQALLYVSTDISGISVGN